MATSEISSITVCDDKRRYLIRIDGECICLINNEHDAIKTVDSIATSEEKKLSGPNRTIFRRTLRDGHEIHILSQTSGLIFSGAMVKKTIIDLSSVPMINYAPYAEKIAKFKAEKAQKIENLE